MTNVTKAAARERGTSYKSDIFLNDGWRKESEKRNSGTLDEIMAQSSDSSTLGISLPCKCHVVSLVNHSYSVHR